MAVALVSRELEPVTIQSPQPLLGRTLVLTAHPDDELACAALLQRMAQPTVVIATDGAPKDPYFWGPFGTRERYASIRREEVGRSLESIGVASWVFLSDVAHGHQFTDQALHKNLINAVSTVLECVYEFAPEAVLAPAYEGGHPDHDVCSFLAGVAGNAAGVPVWEMPLYHRNVEGGLVSQDFLETTGTELFVSATESELRGRERMLSAYNSQTDLREFVTKSVESYRLQPHYDYLRPPHIGMLNYEVWGWGLSGTEVCSCIANCQAYLRTLRRNGVQARAPLQAEEARSIRSGA